jgi:peptidoglycan glycosyltransferase
MKANVPGQRICGKTGSAQVDGQAETNAWFIGFIDEESIPYAICVAVMDVGGGGLVAAPVAGEIFKILFDFQ